MKASRLAGSNPPVTLWDASVRVLHWSLATSTLAAVASGFAGVAWFGVHKTCGALILGLSMTRLVLGFAGSTTAKFGNFVRGPSEICKYVGSLAQAGHRRHFGHNPLGALMIVALIGCLLAQGLLGLFASDGIAMAGPFAHIIDEHLAEALGALHGRVALLITALVSIHIIAVIAYRLVWHLDLIGPMISGRAPADSFVSVPDDWEPGLRSGEVLLLAAVTLTASALLAFA